MLHSLGLIETEKVILLEKTSTTLLSKSRFLVILITYRGNNGNECLESECNYLIKYFDSEFNGHLNYAE